MRYNDLGDVRAIGGEVFDELITHAAGMLQKYEPGERNGYALCLKNRGLEVHWEARQWS